MARSSKGSFFEKRPFDFLDVRTLLNPVVRKQHSLAIDRFNMMRLKVFSRLSRFLFACSPLLIPAVLPASDRADWQERMQPIQPRMYLCRRAPSPIVVDGKLDDPAWSAVRWTEDFVDIEGRIIEFSIDDD